MRAVIAALTFLLSANVAADFDAAGVIAGGLFGLVLPILGVYAGITVGMIYGIYKAVQE